MVDWKNKEEFNKYHRDYKRRNKYQSNYFIKNYKNNIQYKNSFLLKIKIRNILKNKHNTSKVIGLIGCNKCFLKWYFESKFRDGMDWNNYGNLWEMDHIKPCCSFDLKNENEQKKCFHYSNLQPLLITENRENGRNICQQ